MAQTGFTPIQLYRTTTAAAVPTAGNLAAGELAINLTDKKLYAKDASNNVFLLADASSGGTTAANLAGGLAGSLPYQSAPNTTLFLSIGAANRVLTSTGTAPQWVNSLTGLTGVSSSGLTNTSLTSGRLVYSTTGGAQTDSANLTFDGTRLTVADFADSSLTSGRVPYASTGGALVDSANLLYAGADLTVYGVRVGRGAGAVSTNTAVGESALISNTSGIRNTALGSRALISNTTGNLNNAIGSDALLNNTTGVNNTAIGAGALALNGAGSHNIAIGVETLFSNTTASSNTAVGHQALVSNTTASNNTAVGYQAGYSNTTGTQVVAIGYRSAFANTSGSNNIAVGFEALQANTTATNSTAVGYQALYNSNRTADANAFNTAVGYRAGFDITTGSKNTILGAYTGNQGGLDIRTANNYIVLSDGDGNPRQIIDGSGNVGLGVTPSAWASGWRALELQGGSVLSPNTSFLISAQNAYYDGSWKYKTSGIAAGRYAMDGTGNGTYQWSSAAAGTAGNAITFVDVLKVERAKSLALEGATSQSGTGITFPATQSASSDANTLDDYEEGTWTATLKGSVSDPSTPVTKTGRYTKIGRMVQFEVSFDDVTTTGASGNVTVTGLPFTAASGRTVHAVGLYNFDLNTGTSAFGLIDSGTTIAFNASKDDDAWYAIQHNAGINRYLTVSGTYSV
jgi:hypothetical protein